MHFDFPGLLKSGLGIGVEGDDGHQLLIEAEKLRQREHSRANPTEGQSYRI